MVKSNLISRWFLDNKKLLIEELQKKSEAVLAEGKEFTFKDIENGYKGLKRDVRSHASLLEKWLDLGRIGDLHYYLTNISGFINFSIQTSLYLNLKIDEIIEYIMLNENDFNHLLIECKNVSKVSNLEWNLSLHTKYQIPLCANLLTLVSILSYIHTPTANGTLLAKDYKYYKTKMEEKEKTL